MRALWVSLAFLCLSGCGPGQPALPPGVVQAPALGENWLVINYWAIWCAPCREEIPELNRLARNTPGLTVYAVNFDGVEGEALVEQAADLGIDFPLLALDPGPALGSTPPTALPTTLIVAPGGEVVTRLIGPQTEAGLQLELARARASMEEK